MVSVLLVSIRGAVSAPFGTNIGDFTSIVQGSSNCVPLWFGLWSGNLTDFLGPLLKRLGDVSSVPNDV